VADLTGRLESAIKEKIAPKDIYNQCPCGSGAKYKFCCMKKEIVSALYPAACEEKRWVDGVLARKKGLGF
jgi:hypothetical protein